MNLDNLQTFVDETGTYLGHCKNGVPNGEGIKCYNFGIKAECNWINGLKTGKGFLDFGILRLEVKFTKGHPKRLLSLPKAFKYCFPKQFSFRFPVNISESQGIYQETLSAEENFLSLYCFQGRILNNCEFIKKKIGKLKSFVKSGETIITESEDDTLEGFCEIKGPDDTRFGFFNKGIANRLIRFTEKEKVKHFRIFHQDVLVSETHFYDTQSLKIKTLKQRNIMRITHFHFKIEYDLDGFGFKTIRGELQDIKNLIRAFSSSDLKDYKEIIIKVLGIVSIFELVASNID